jgi:hypothetical protein
MIGHLPLINMRMSGQAPKYISIEDHKSLNAHEWHEWDDFPVICIAKDDLFTLDLRFAIGLTVFLTSFDERRAKAVHQKLIDAKARVITSSVLLPGQPYFRQTGWSETYIGK